ncbi:MAG TPA: plastocyanin/azurin family copper-binding protein [Solirubrobacterales bacterium]|nr:plastocyanin/azurin family copper-binding protein [Solirubrobacterales bacterium]
MKKAAVALLFVLAALALVACGGSDSSSSESAPAETTTESEAGGGAEAGGEGEAEGGSEGSAATVDFEAASSGLAYTAKSAEAEAGEVTIDFTNPQAVPHDVAIEDSGGEVIAETEQLTEGSDSTTANLKPGTYTFSCTVPGHREAGMEGTLTVK